MLTLNFVLLVSIALAVMAFIVFVGKDEEVRCSTPSSLALPYVTAHHDVSPGALQTPCSPTRDSPMRWVSPRPSSSSLCGFLKSGPRSARR